MPAPEFAVRRLPHKPASRAGAERRPAHPSVPRHLECWTVGAGIVNLIALHLPTPAAFVRMFGRLSGYEPDTPRWVLVWGTRL